jgi:tRNA A-37 threonylcarbamoyl transferase component Bud32
MYIRSKQAVMSNLAIPTYDELYYIKHSVTLKEYEMHKHIQSLGIVNTPKILAYDRDTRIMLMERINYMNISDYYGENDTDITPELFARIREIIKTLYDNNVVYPDITGYNFIEYNKKIWIIDFEHAKFKPLVQDDFVVKFINGENKWNPRFK